MAHIAPRYGPFRIAIWAILQNRGVFSAIQAGANRSASSILPLPAVLNPGGGNVKLSKAEGGAEACVPLSAKSSCLALCFLHKALVSG